MSEQDFTVEKIIGEPRQWQGKQGGTFVSYKLDLVGVGVAELSQRPETPAPKVGDVIVGMLEPSNGDFPPKLRKAKPAFGGGGGGGGGSRPRDPEERKSIQAQASQKVAIDIVRVAVENNLKAEDVDRRVREVAARLFAQIEDLKAA